MTSSSNTRLIEGLENLLRIHGGLEVSSRYIGFLDVAVVAEVAICGAEWQKCKGNGGEINGLIEAKVDQCRLALQRATRRKLEEEA